MSRPRIPLAVEGLLEWWLPRVRAALGLKVKSVVLYGGVVLDDFAPGWSDVDVCVVLDTPIEQDEAAAIGAVHDEMREQFVDSGKGGWRSGQAIEGPYVPIELTAGPEATGLCFVAGGTTRRWADGHPISPFDRYMLSHFGACYAGQTVRFAPPTRQALVVQLREDLPQLVEPDHARLSSSIWLAGTIHWIARSVVFWRDGVMLSKTAALEQEIEAGSPFADAYELALRLRREGSAATRDHLPELRERFMAIAKPAADTMTELIDD